MSSPKTSRATHVALIVASLVAAFPLWTAKYLPFADLAEHEAVSGALAHASDPTWRIGEHYTVMFSKTPYWLYDGLGALLARGTGDAILAHRLLLTLVCLSLPWAMRSFLGALGRQRILAVIAAPLFWSKSLQFGFVPFVAAIPALFFALAAFVRLLRRPSVLRAVGTLGLAVVLSMLHSVVYALFLLTAGGWLVLLRMRRSTPSPTTGSGKREDTRTGPSMLTLVPFASAVLALPYAHIAARGGEGGLTFMRPWLTAYQLPSWTYDLWKGPLDDVAAALFWLGAFALFRSGYIAAGLRLRGRAIFLAWPLIASLLLVFLLPTQVDSVFVVNLRLGPIVACAFLALLHRANTREARVGMGLVVLGGALTSLAAVQGVRRAAAEVRDFDRITESVPVGSRTYVMNFDLDSQVTHFPPWLHLGSAIVAQRGGVVQYSFTSLLHWPLYDRVSPRKHSTFWFNRPCYFDLTDAAYYDSILVRGAYLPLPQSALASYVLVAEAPPFYLWRKRETAGMPPGLPISVPDSLRPPPCTHWGDTAKAP